MIKLNLFILVAALSIGVGGLQMNPMAPSVLIANEGPDPGHGGGCDGWNCGSCPGSDACDPSGGNPSDPGGGGGEPPPGSGWIRFS